MRRVVAVYLPRVIIALIFLAVGLDKFVPNTSWVRIFEHIGVGQWFRYLTGVIQVAGAVMTLVPRTFTVGIVLLSLTMLGAVVAWFTVLHAPATAVVPAFLLAILLLTGWLAR